MRDGGGMSGIERKKHWMAMIAEATIIFQDLKIVEYVAFLEAENERLNEEKTARLKWRSTSGWEPFDINNPMAYEDLRDFYISYIGMKDDTQ